MTSVLPLNLRALSAAMMLSAKRGRGIGPLQTRQLAALLDMNATTIENQSRAIDKLSAVVRDLSPVKKARRAKR